MMKFKLLHFEINKILLLSLLGILLMCSAASATPLNVIKNPTFEGVYTGGCAENWTIYGNASYVSLSENINPSYIVSNYTKSQRVISTSTGSLVGVRSASTSVTKNKTYIALIDVYKVSGASEVDIVYDTIDHAISIPSTPGWHTIRYKFTPTNSTGLSVYFRSASASEFYVSRCYVEQTEIYLDSVSYDTTNTTNVNVTINNSDGIARSCTYTTVDNTAIANIDYTESSGTLTFETGEMSKNITIQMNGAGVGKLRKQFSVLLGGENVSLVDNISTIYVKRPAGLAFVFDDVYINNWYAQRDFMNGIGAKVTFDVAQLSTLTPTEISKLTVLHDDGNEIADHTLDHTNALSSGLTPEEYAQTCSIPNLKLLESLGYRMPVSFVYPGTARNVAFDNELLKYHPIVRGGLGATDSKISTARCYYPWDGSRLVYGCDMSEGGSLTVNGAYAGIDEAKRRGDVIVLYSHDISNTPKSVDISIAEFQAIMQYAYNNGLEFYTLVDLIDNEYPYGILTSSIVDDSNSVTFNYTGIAHANHVIDYDDGTNESITDAKTHTYTQYGNFNVTVNSTNYAGSNISNISIFVPMHKNTTAISKEVKIYANGTTEIIGNNRILQSEIANMLVTPSNDSVSVNISIWETTQRVWIESSENHSISTLHVIGDFPANTDIQIKRDDIDYETVTSNETGYIEWVYDGGFSEHIFSIECYDFNASQTSGAYPLTTQFTTSSKGIDAYYWDFENDGIIDSTKQNPAHTYGQTGDYSVNLTVHTSEGNVSTVKPDYITVENPTFSEDPLAWFNWVFSYLFGRF